MKLPVSVFLLFLFLVLALAGCQQSSLTATPSASPITFPTEGRPGENVTVAIKVVDNLPCELILGKSYKTEIANYFSPFSTRTLAYPDNNHTLVWVNQIPAATAPGSYVLRVVQMRDPQDKEGTEIFSRPFLIK